MKKIIFLTFFLIVMLLVPSCDKDEIAAPSYDKYNIQNDSNWVEITDTINLVVRCFLWEKDYDYKIIMDSNSYNNFKKHINECINVKFPIVDFNNKSVLAFVFITNDTWDSVKIKFYRNDDKKEFLFLVHISNMSPIWNMHFNQMGIIVPKIPDNYYVNFDTVFVN